MFRDIESGEVVTLGQLMEEYKQNRQALPSEYNYSFDEYVANCLTENNGTLERLSATYKTRRNAKIILISLARFRGFTLLFGQKILVFGIWLF